MSQTHGLVTMPIPAAADLTANQYYIVKLDANGAAVLAGANQGIGAVQNKAKLGAEAASIPIGGTAKVVAGGVIAPGDRITSDATGKAIAVAAHTHTENTAAAYVQNAVTAIAAVIETIGVALEAAAAGDVIEYLVAPSRA